MRVRGQNRRAGSNARGCSLPIATRLLFTRSSRAIGVTDQTVERCLRRAERFGVIAALDDSPRPGRERVITEEARTFVVDLACRKPKGLGYPHELWTTRLLTRHIREHGPAAGHECLANLAQGMLCKILAAYEIKPHKVRYYLERRDPLFDEKMAEVLCVYREVELLKQSGSALERESAPLAIISYDEKPGIQAIGTTAPDLPPEPLRHGCLARDHEYVRHGTLSLLAGIDLVTGAVHASVEERHRSREFIGFLQKLDATYPSSTAIKLILDNHSAHISKETKAWLATQPEGRFTFVFTPKHGSWLNLVEGFFSKLARSALRYIRVAFTSVTDMWRSHGVRHCCSMSMILKRGHSRLSFDNATMPHSQPDLPQTLHWMWSRRTG